LERGPLSSDEFKAFSVKVVPFIHVASKVKGDPYPDLLDEKGGDGWPFVCFLDHDGNLIARQDRGAMRDGVAAFQATLEDQVKAFYELKQKADAGDKEAKVEFFMMRFDLGHVGVAEMRKALAKDSPLDDFQKDAVREHLVELATQEVLKGLEQDKPETFGPFAKKLLAQHKTIGLPEGGAGITPWYVILEDAYTRKDPATFKLAFTAIKAAGMRRKAFVDKHQSRLEEISKDK
jgi:hypothetical protein